MIYIKHLKIYIFHFQKCHTLPDYLFLRNLPNEFYITLFCKTEPKNKDLTEKKESKKKWLDGAHSKVYMLTVPQIRHVRNAKWCKIIVS